jgi:hypothetical protein
MNPTLSVHGTIAHIPVMGLRMAMDIVPTVKVSQDASALGFVN